MKGYDMVECRSHGLLMFSLVALMKVMMLQVWGTDRGGTQKGLGTGQPTLHKRLREELP
jgi:hypothetical protein